MSNSETHVESRWLCWNISFTFRLRICWLNEHFSFVVAPRSILTGPRIYPNLSAHWPSVARGWSPLCECSYNSFCKNSSEVRVRITSSLLPIDPPCGVWLELARAPGSTSIPPPSQDFGPFLTSKLPAFEHDLISGLRKRRWGGLDAPSGVGPLTNRSVRQAMANSST